MKITALLDRTHEGDVNGWDESGNPTVTTFGNALQVWASAQDSPPTINDAALAFNVEPGLIRQAISEHYWMFIGKNDIIEHEGE